MDPEGKYGGKKDPPQVAVRQIGGHAPEGGNRHDTAAAPDGDPRGCGPMPERLRSAPVCAVCKEPDPPPNRVAVAGLDVWLHTGTGCEDEFARLNRGPDVPRPPLAEPAARTNGGQHQAATEKQPDAVAAATDQAEKAPPAHPDQPVSAPDPVPSVPVRPQGMLDGDWQRLKRRLQNQKDTQQATNEARARAGQPPL
jgi:hypothetical protein